MSGWLRGEQNVPLGCFGKRSEHLYVSPGLAASQRCSSDKISPSQFQWDWLNYPCLPIRARLIIKTHSSRKQRRWRRGRSLGTGESGSSGLGSAQGCFLTQQEPIPQPQTLAVHRRPTVVKAAPGGAGWGCREPPISQGCLLSFPSGEPQCDLLSCAQGKPCVSRGSWLRGFPFLR